MIETIKTLVDEKIKEREECKHQYEEIVDIDGNSLKTSFCKKCGKIKYHNLRKKER